MCMGIQYRMHEQRVCEYTHHMLTWSFFVDQLSFRVCCLCCAVLCCAVLCCVVPKALLPKGKGREVYPRVQVNGLGCVCCVRAVCKCVVA